MEGVNIMIGIVLFLSLVGIVVPVGFVVAATWPYGET
jgi:hypothetical protein